MAWVSDEELANAIHRRREQARLVRSAPFALAQFNECHANAERYAAENPGCRVVGGWLLEDFAHFSYFNAHSVVQAEDGSLLDPTPLLSVCLFLPHWGTEDEFAVLRQNRTRVQYPYPDYELSRDPPVDEPGEYLCKRSLEMSGFCPLEMSCSRDGLGKNERTGSSTN